MARKPKFIKEADVQKCLNDLQTGLRDALDQPDLQSQFARSVNTILGCSNDLIDLLVDVDADFDLIDFKKRSKHR